MESQNSLKSKSDRSINSHYNFKEELITAKLDNYTKGLEKAVWNEFQKKIRIWFPIVGIMAALITGGGIYSISNMIDLEIKQIELKYESILNEIIERKIKEKREDIKGLTDQVISSASEFHTEIKVLRKETFKKFENLQNYNLVHSVRFGEYKTLKYLLSEGLDVNYRDNFVDKTLLMWAAERGYGDISELLIKYGADVNAKMADGTTALMYAVESQNPQIVMQNLEKYAEVDATKIGERTALMIAVETQDHEIIKLLLKHGANPYKKDKNGNSPMTIAKEKGYNEIIDLLEEVKKK